LGDKAKINFKRKKKWLRRSERDDSLLIKSERRGVSVSWYTTVEMENRCNTAEHAPKSSRVICEKRRGGETVKNPCRFKEKLGV